MTDTIYVDPLVKEVYAVIDRFYQERYLTEQGRTQIEKEATKLVQKYVHLADISDKMEQ